MNKTYKLIASIILCELSGIIGSVFTVQSIPPWYQTLEKPFFVPPNWLFAPVWTILYALMGLYLYLMWISPKKEARSLIKIFLFHLAVNTAWSIVFFGFRQILGGLVVILVLLFLIAYLIVKAWPINRYASYFLLPYLFWVTFATILNAALWVLN